MERSFFTIACSYCRLLYEKNDRLLLETEKNNLLVIYSILKAVTHTFTVYWYYAQSSFLHTNISLLNKADPMLMQI